MAKLINPLQFAVPLAAAEAAGVKRTTLNSAIRRGEIDTARLGDGTLIVSLPSAKLWAADRPKRGRPFSKPQPGDQRRG